MYVASFIQVSTVYVVSLPHTHDGIPPPVVANETFATSWHRRYARLINVNAIMQLCTYAVMYLCTYALMHLYAEVSDHLAYLSHPDIT